MKGNIIWSQKAMAYWYTLPQWSQSQNSIYLIPLIKCPERENAQGQSGWVVGSEGERLEGWESDS